ncbi:MAG: hypothetical protein K6T31_02180, partial [Alicyclobacillus sp.]|nr:hypothetical protein [Alicyclobacillus sp.]
SSPAPDPAAVRVLADAIRTAQWPVIITDHTGRHDGAFRALCELAERWAIPVIDRGGRLNLPTTHPMNLTGDERAALERADVVVALDVRDLFGTLSAIDRTRRTTRPVIAPGTRVFTVSLQDYIVRSLTADYQRLYPAELALLADTKHALPALLEALGQPGEDAVGARVAARRTEVSAWHRRLREQWLAEARRVQADRPIATLALALALWETVGDRDFVLANGDLHGEVQKVFELTQPRQYLGESGGGGLGYGIGAAVGAALAHRNSGKLVVNIQSDGDLLFTSGGLWTMAHHRLPVLNVMFNNRSYYNSEEHQMNMARHRGRDVERAVIGTRIEDPAVDFAKLAESMGVVGIGPVEEPEQLIPALREALRVVEEERRPVLVDVVSQPR